MIQAAHATASTGADVLWPRRTGIPGLLRAAVLAVLGACLLTVSAKVSVPGPVPMTLQTLAVLMLGAALGPRIAIASVLVYLGEGAMGWPVFVNTPPLPAGPAYLVGPTAGFLAGFVVAAGIVGLAAARGLARRPVLFLAALAVADVAILACGWAWLAYGLPLHGGLGMGAQKAFAVGIQPFLLGEAVKVALAAALVPATVALAERVRG